MEKPQTTVFRAMDCRRAPEMIRPGRVKCFLGMFCAAVKPEHRSGYSRFHQYAMHWCHRLIIASDAGFRLLPGTAGVPSQLFGQTTGKQSFLDAEALGDDRCPTITNSPGPATSRRSLNNWSEPGMMRCFVPVLSPQAVGGRP